MYKKAYFAGGCFWGVEHLMQQQNGVVDVVSGYMGGDFDNPTYEDVCSDVTGHAEVVEVCYDPQVVDYETILKLFMEIHDPTQADGQGPDIGSQYRSEIFYNDDDEKNCAIKVIDILRDKGFDVVTRVTPASTFWKAENYHQDYYVKHNKRPYCHFRVKRF